MKSNTNSSSVNRNFFDSSSSNSIDNATGICELCEQQSDPSFLLVGKVSGKDGIIVHRNCLYFGGNNLLQNVNLRDVEDPLFGFTVESIRQQIIDTSDNTCCYCYLKQAGVKCKVCRKTYHMPCGIRNECQFHFETFDSYCSDHRQEQLPCAINNNAFAVCPICEELLLPETGYHQIYCPVCSVWFHRDCIQQWAFKVGLFLFRCPVCNDTSFHNTLRAQGFEIPSKVAAWEVDYADYYRKMEHGGLSVICRAKKCFSDYGREYSDPNGGEFSLMICCICGDHYGMHPICSGENCSPISWKCETCRGVLFN